MHTETTVPKSYYTIFHKKLIFTTLIQNLK